MAELHKGIFKLMEEMNELNTNLAKRCAFPTGEHPDKQGDLNRRIEKEIGDVLAAIDYYVEKNGLNTVDIYEHVEFKLYLFNKWGLSGIEVKDDD